MIRRWCAPIIDLAPFASNEQYIDRRLEIDPVEVNQRFLRASRLSAMLLDTGYHSAEILQPAEMAAAAGIPAHQVLRIEAVAEATLAAGGEAANFPRDFAEALSAAAGDAVGLKSILAYRGGFDLDQRPPSDSSVVEAAGQVMKLGETGSWRLTDRTLLMHCLWAGIRLAQELGFPIQLHVGYGDSDLTLHLTNPSLLTPLIRSTVGMGVNFVLLHCYPFHREAAYLAAVYPHVYFDIGLAVNYTGPSSPDVIAQSLELTPFTKVLYSSDAYGLAELFYLGSVLFRTGLAATLDAWIRSDNCSVQEAERIVGLVASGNATRIYPLPPI
jgi:uncharacterized protein